MVRNRNIKTKLGPESQTLPSSLSYSVLKSELGTGNLGTQISTKLKLKPAFLPDPSNMENNTHDHSIIVQFQLPQSPRFGSGIIPKSSLSSIGNMVAAVVAMIGSNSFDTMPLYGDVFAILQQATSGFAMSWESKWIPITQLSSDDELKEAVAVLESRGWKGNIIATLT